VTRLERVLLGLLLVGAWVLRASPFFRPQGVASWPVDYDEGVYVAAAGALARGSLPWRDFVFLHPPGALVLFAPLSALGPLGALLAARVLVTVVGTLSTWLVFMVVRRHAGLAGAFVGAALYATWPEVVVNERRALLEPLLNAVALGALVALHRPALRTGLVGLALAIKSWGVLWLVGLAVAARSWKLLAGTVLVGLVVVCLMPATMREQLLLVHLTRPPDGDLERSTRLYEMFVARSAVPALLLVGCAPWTWRHRRDPLVQGVAVVFVMFVLAFLAAAAFWNQYDTALAAPFAVLCGLGVGFAWPQRWPAWRAAPLALALTTPALINVIGVRHEAAPTQLASASALAQLTTPTTRVCAFEAFDALLADRWPSPPFDSYGQQLVGARRAGRFRSTSEAFQAPDSQLGLREALGSCEVVVRGWRGEWQMNLATRTWFDASFEPRDGLHFVRRTSVQP
jgi:hypothetical protein